MKIIAKGIASTALLIPLLSYASWPIFSVPSSTQINSHIVTEGCPLGEGKIPLSTKLPFKAFNNTWYWEYSGSASCKKIPSKLDYVAFEKNGSDSGDKFTTSFGTASQVLFQFVFTIPYCQDWDPTCNWHCVAISNNNPPTVFSCAYDQLKKSQHT